jgi:hypothetical protein
MKIDPFKTPDSRGGTTTTKGHYLLHFLLYALENGAGLNLVHALMSDVPEKHRICITCIINPYLYKQ